MATLTSRYPGLLLFLLLSSSACEIVASFDRDRITEAAVKPPEQLHPMVPPEAPTTPLDAGPKDAGADDGGFEEPDSGLFDAGPLDDAAVDAEDAAADDAGSDAGSDEDAGDAATDGGF